MMMRSRSFVAFRAVPSECRFTHAEDRRVEVLRRYYFLSCRSFGRIFIGGVLVKQFSLMCKS